MRRSRRILRDESWAPRPPVYLKGFRARRRPRPAWAALALLLAAVVLAVWAARG